LKQQTAFYGWKLLAVVWLIVAITTGFTYYGGNIMNSYMATALHLDRKSLGLAFGMFGLCMGLVVPFGGFCVNRWGVRLTLSAGTLLACLGALGMALVVENMAGVLIAYGLVMGVGSSLGGLLAAQTLITHWFQKRLALALTLMLTGTVTGGFVAAPLFDRVIVAFHGNWRAGWFLMAAACGVAFLCALLLVRNAPSDIGQLVDGGDGGGKAAPQPGATVKTAVYKTTEAWTFGEALRHPTWWLLSLGTVCFLTTYGMIVGHGVMHFKDLGHPVGKAAMFLGLLPLAGLAGKTVVGVCGDRIEPRFLWAGAMVMMATGMLTGVTARSDFALLATALMLGAGNSISYPCMITLVANYFGKTAYASFMGAMLLIAALAAAAGPVLAGFVFDSLGTYTLAFYPAAAVCLLGGLMMPFVKPPVRKLGTGQTCPAL
jgi:MFS family permease